MNLAIVGYGPTVNPVPFDDPDWDCWGLNEGYQVRPYYFDGPWNAWFNLHHDHVIRFTSPACMANLTRMKVSVFMLEENKAVPHSKRYPIEKILKIFPDYFTSSIPYMVCLGWLFGYDNIRIFGVNMGTEEETGQRACIEHHAGIIRGLGGTVTADPASKLFRHDRRYGYETDIPDNFIERQHCGYGSVYGPTTDGNINIQ